MPSRGLRAGGTVALSLRSLFSLPLSKLGWKRFLLLLLVFAAVVGLLSARLWRVSRPECLITVQPGESLRAAVESAEAGGVICLARGVWTENILIDKSLTIIGSGAARTTIGAALALSPVVEISGSDDGPIDVKIEGLTVSGEGGGSGVGISGVAEVEVRDCILSGRLYGIEVADSARLILTNSTISGHKQRGIILVDSAWANINGSRISGNLGLGIWLSHSAEATFVNCEISGNRGHGLWLRDDAWVELNNCLVSKNEGHGLWLTERSAAHLRSSEFSENWDDGVRVEGLSEAELDGCDVLSNWHGVELRDAARATIVNSDVSANRFDGIRVQSSSAATAFGSVIAANRRGVWVSGGADADISDCFIEENLGYGVISWSSGEVGGEGNRFRANGVDLGGNLSGKLRVPLKEPAESAISWPDDRYASVQEAVDALLPGGILLLKSGSYVAGLTIGKEVSIEAGDGQVTLQARGAALPVFSLVHGAELHLSSITVSGGATGLAISAGARAVVVGCNISDNTEGINLSHSSSANMKECGIMRNERNGVVVGGAAQAVITRCSISNSNGYGVVVTDSAQVTIADSIVAGNGGGGGIVFSGSCQVILEANTIVDNQGFGAATYERSCFVGSPWVFQGHVLGHSNVFEGNERGDVCPPELGFLSTVEGGELNLRPSPFS